MPPRTKRPAGAAARAKATSAANPVPAEAAAPAGRSLRIVARLHAYAPRHNAGAEWMAHSLLRALAARGHQVEAWLTRYSPDRETYELDGVRVVPLQARLDGAAAVRSADVLLAHLETVPATGALARGAGTPLVVVCHNTHPPTFRALASGETALAVYNSAWMAREAQVYFAEFPARLRPKSQVIVRPLVDAAEYATEPGDRVTLINCCPDKGGEVLRRLAKRMPDTEFLAVRGAYGDQVDYSSLDNIEVLDHVAGSRMRDAVYGRTRILLMPSRYESWGRAGTEALASGIPVVAQPTPGLVESLGDAGVFVDRSDLDGWVAALEQLLGDETEWKAASERARARSAELDPRPELKAWCEAVEALAP
ncbi:glycosyltransferase family 4 protein [Phaeacidiphilus oryzae]|uniref:glycosyltransferase family 4 protein n=1 Tax=Phaeacidiphilus oryzae TaxID=348818 RepID=UPI000B118778|nr:glycosyltransferase family 4 protein [Phaeacidiphilus oryzae]